MYIRHTVRIQKSSILKHSLFTISNWSIVFYVKVGDMYMKRTLFRGGKNDQSCEFRPFCSLNCQLKDQIQLASSLDLF